jgi:hypothetical protein
MDGVVNVHFRNYILMMPSIIWDVGLCHIKEDRCLFFPAAFG